MANKPKVSIVTIAYNQERYIGEALESFVTQQTDFPFEVIVADDCSPDGTQKIIRDYAKRYPDIIKPILRKKNIGAAANSVSALRAATGDYVALCEGDDYWTDPTKLQRQVDFLDKHPEYVLCFHPVRVFFEGSDAPDTIFPEEKAAASFSLPKLLKRNFIQTNSVMYRRQSYDTVPEDILPLDWYLHLYHAQFGKIGFINRVMAAYRRHPGGIWWDSHNNVEEIWKRHGQRHFKLYVELLRLYGERKEYADILYGNMANALRALSNVDQKYKDTFVEQMVTLFPREVAGYLVAQMNWLDGERKTVEARDGSIRELKATIEQKDWHLARKDEEIESIKASKFWRFRNIVAKLIGRAAV